LPDTARLFLDIKLFVPMKRIVGIAVVVNMLHRKRIKTISHTGSRHLIQLHAVDKV
jgi:hypothetical protein